MATAMDAATHAAMDLELIGHLDFEEAKACEIRKVQCEEPAAWLTVHDCCGFSRALCGPHAVELRKWLALASVIACGICQHRGTTVIFLPLGGE